MASPVQDALINLMIVTASSDLAINDAELEQIQALIERSPVFQGFNAARLPEVAALCIDQLNSPEGLELVIGAAVDAIPQRLHDTAYALAIEVAAVDLTLPQSELRMLEAIRDRLQVDRLVTAAIEVSARARSRRI